MVAKPVPVTAGTPYSRHTIAAWLIMPPVSVTVAWILPKIGAQLGAVNGATRISPSCNSPIWSAEKMTLATPSTMPGDAAMPRSSPSFASPPPSQALTLSEVIPQSMTVNGSVMTSGGTPSAGLGFALLSASHIPLRRSMIGGQYDGPAGASGVAHEL